MRIIDLTVQEFETFADKHPLKNFCQTAVYAKLMGEKGYNFDYIGYQDDSNQIIAASLVLSKRIGGFFKFAYAPKGFLIDYYNTDLLNSFIKDISNYLSKKGISFVKINPEIIIGELNIKKGFIPVYNQNVKIIDDLKALGFKRRREIEPLNLIFPRLSPFINLKNFDLNKTPSEIKDSINYSLASGLVLEEVTSKEMPLLYEFVKNNTNESINFYRSLLNIFGTNSSEILLVKVDYEKCLINVRERYDKELDHNNECNQKIQENNNEINLNEKMQSDKDLLSLKNAIVEATEGLKKNKYRYIGGIIVVKYFNRISIVASGYDHNFSNLFPEYFIQYALIERFKKEYDFLDLNGLAGNFSTESKYYNFNKEQLCLNPNVYEFIGEFDLILNDNEFKRIQGKGGLSSEFISNIKV
jgi:lipid II:glycine glycyltransferase (peptidoglycan interpeptide bridge formation enzyme)